MEGFEGMTLPYIDHQIYDIWMNTTVTIKSVDNNGPVKRKFGQLSLFQQRQFVTNFPEKRPEENDINMDADAINDEEFPQLPAGATSQVSSNLNQSGSNPPIVVSEFKVVKNKRARDSEDNFNYPRNKIANLVTSNKFSGLKPELLNDKNTPSPSQFVNNAKRVQTPKTRFIVIKQVTSEILKKIAATESCSFKAAPSGTFTRLFPSSPEAYRAIITKLDELKIQHYLTPERSTQPLKAVIRGLPIDCPTDDILQELKSLDYPVIKVAQMTKFNTQKPMPLFQIQLEDTNKARTIFQIEGLMHYIIKIENYNRPSRTMQCYRCQYYHHSSQYCKLNPRCVKCGESHETKDCPLGVSKVENPKCANCSGPHTASFRGCPKFPENIRKNFSSTPVRPTLSFASALKPNSADLMTPQTTVPQSTAPSTPFNLGELNSILDDIARELNAANYNDLIQKFKNALTNIKNTSDPATKLSIFLAVLNASSSPVP